jgi:hypothetical protein
MNKFNIPIRTKTNYPINGNYIEHWVYSNKNIDYSRLLNKNLHGIYIELKVKL